MKRGVVVDRIRGKSWRLPSGESVTSARGWDLTIITDRPGPQYETLDPSTTVIVLPELRYDSLSTALTSLHAQHPFSAISTTSELFLDDVASLRDRLGIAGPGSTYTMWLRDKWAMKQIALSAGVPCAWGVLGGQVDQGISLLKHSGQCVIKPRRLSGSRGVRITRKPSDLSRWAAECPNPNEYLIEEFVQGPMLHMDGLISEGQLLWQLSAYERPTHLCGGKTPLSSYTVDDPILLTLAGDFIRRVVAAWELAADVFHCEVFWTERGLVLCEIAGRPGGAGVNEVFEATRGINLRHAKTFLDFGESVPPSRLLDVLDDGEQTQGGWSVFYSPGSVWTGVDDEGLTSHHSRDIRSHGVAPAVGFSGVGVVTYTYLGRSTADVRATINRYERGVRVLVDDSSGSQR